jgi:RHS repeat-associated protein
LRYAGYCYDEHSKLYYLSARSYDPLTRQFISKDPAKADGEESAYQYCGGEPISKADPSGMSSVYASRRNDLKGTFFKYDIGVKWSDGPDHLSWTAMSVFVRFKRTVWRYSVSKVRLGIGDAGQAYNDRNIIYDYHSTPFPGSSPSRRNSDKFVPVNRPPQFGYSEYRAWTVPWAQRHPLVRGHSPILAAQFKIFARVFLYDVKLRKEVLPVTVGWEEYVDSSADYSPIQQIV